MYLFSCTTCTEQFQIASYCMKSTRKSQDGCQSAFATEKTTCALALAVELQQAGAQSGHSSGALVVSNELAHNPGNSLAFTQNTEVTTAFAHALAMEPGLVPAEGIARAPDAPGQVPLPPAGPPELEFPDDTADFVDIATCPTRDCRAQHVPPRVQGTSCRRGAPSIQSAPRMRPWSGVALLQRC